MAASASSNSAAVEAANVVHAGSAAVACTPIRTGTPADSAAACSSAALSVTASAVSK